MKYALRSALILLVLASAQTASAQTADMRNAGFPHAFLSYKELNDKLFIKP